MASRTLRSPNRTAALFGLGVVVALMTGVGGHQLAAAGALPVLTPATPGQAMPSTSRAAAGAPMCAGRSAAGSDGRPASLISFGSDRWRDTSATWSPGSPVGLGGVCD